MKIQKTNSPTNGVTNQSPGIRSVYHNMSAMCQWLPLPEEFSKDGRVGRKRAPKTAMAFREPNIALLGVKYAVRKRALID